MTVGPPGRWGRGRSGGSEALSKGTEHSLWFGVHPKPPTRGRWGERGVQSSPRKLGGRWGGGGVFYGMVCPTVSGVAGGPLPHAPRV